MEVDPFSGVASEFCSISTDGFGACYVARMYALNGGTPVMMRVVLVYGVILGPGYFGDMSLV